jgi:L-threonylcarbamoyladenylate synthase
MTLVIDASRIEDAAAILKSGEPVAMPTETVYGLAAPIFDLEAIQKIFSLKKRPSDNPLIAHVSNLAMVETIAQNIPSVFFSLAERFWPGPLTLVLPKKPSVPSLVSQTTIAVRMPSHPLALRLIDLVGSPLVAPSANLSGRPSPTCAAHVLSDLGGRLAAILDGGECQFGTESTVLSLVSEVPVLLRPGAITRAQLEEVLGEVRDPEKGEPILSPGMKYRHYAPQAKVHLTERLPELPSDAFVLSREPIGFTYRCLDSKHLYSHLRMADQLEFTDIWILLDSVTRKDEALMNRLEKISCGS